VFGGGEGRPADSCGEPTRGPVLAGRDRLEVEKSGLPTHVASPHVIRYLQAGTVWRRRRLACRLMWRAHTWSGTCRQGPFGGGEDWPPDSCGEPTRDPVLGNGDRLEVEKAGLPTDVASPHVVRYSETGTVQMWRRLACRLMWRAHTCMICALSHLHV
jgi:hypothetical protein